MQATEHRNVTGHEVNRTSPNRLLHARNCRIHRHFFIQGVYTMISLHTSGPSKVTVLSNFFIDHFMPEANGEFVKVYIYLLRMLGNPGSSFGLTQMADSFLCTEGDILRALKYWESKNLLSLSYEGTQLTDIALLSPENEAAAPALLASQESFREIGAVSATQDPVVRSMADTAAAVLHSPSDHTSAVPANVASVLQGTVTNETNPNGKSNMEPSLQGIRGNAEVSSASPSSQTRHLTPDRVKELKQNEDIVQLLYIAEQYLGKTLTPTETRKILFFYDELHMSVDLIDYLIEYCVGRDHRSIRYIETVAMAWKEEGITTVEMAKDSTARYSKEYFSILKAMGITNRNPIDTEIALMNTWMKDYGFTQDLIQEACSRTVLQTGQPSFQYADKILQSWKKKNIRTLDDVRLQDAQHQKRKLEKAANKTAQQKPQTQNRFNNFHQREYDFAEYEKKLLNQ